MDEFKILARAPVKGLLTWGVLVTWFFCRNLTTQSKVEDVPQNRRFHHTRFWRDEAELDSRIWEIQHNEDVLVSSLPVQDLPYDLSNNPTHPVSVALLLPAPTTKKGKAKDKALKCVTGGRPETDSDDQDSVEFPVGELEVDDKLDTSLERRFRKSGLAHPTRSIHQRGRTPYITDQLIFLDGYSSWVKAGVSKKHNSEPNRSAATSDLGQLFFLDGY